MGETKKTFKIKLGEIENDIDKEFWSIQYLYESKIADGKLSMAAVLEENQLMKTKYLELGGKIEEHKKSFQKGVAEEKKIQLIIKGMEHDVAGLEKEV
jgi:hypothetical protein